MTWLVHRKIQSLLICKESLHIYIHVNWKHTLQRCYHTARWKNWRKRHTLVFWSGWQWRQPWTKMYRYNQYSHYISCVTCDLVCHVQYKRSMLFGNLEWSVIKNDIPFYIVHISPATLHCCLCKISSSL